jgi:hypothetical protein
MPGGALGVWFSSLLGAGCIAAAVLVGGGEVYLDGSGWGEDLDLVIDLAVDLVVDLDSVVGAEPAAMRVELAARLAMRKLV